MTGPIIAVLGTRYADLSVEQEILGHLDPELRRGDGENRAAILDIARDAEVILCGSRPVFDAGTIAQLQCRAIVRYGIGVDSIDLVAARAHGITVARVSDYGTEAVATHALTLALAGMRRLVEANRRTQAGEWGFNDLRPLHLPSATTAGVVGFGRIGREVARLFSCMGFEVVAFDAFAPVAGVDAVSAMGDLHSLLDRSDVVSLHVPGGDRPLMAAPELARMREDSVLVNTARGSLIDLEALVAGLESGRPRIAALDVYPDEPPDLRLLEPVADRVIATPHMAWYTVESEHDLRAKAAADAARILRGEAPRDPVVAGG